MGWVQSLSAQEVGRWSIGALAGPTVYQGELSDGGLGTLNGESFSFGGQLEYLLTEDWSLRLTAHRGELSAADEDFTFDLYRLARDFSFQTSFTDITLTTRYYPLDDRPFQPFAGIGVGLLFFNPEADLLRNTHLELFDFIKLDLEAEPAQPAIIIPLEVGLNYQLSRRLSGSLSFQYNLTDTDLLDGVSQAGNPNNMDNYGYLNLGFALHFGFPADLDEDGIVDELDECPLKPGSSKTKGCPDQDNDGIRDSDDNCPLAAGSAEYNGCPDTDQDGTPDPYDRCVALAGPPEALGCPPKDTDQDGTLDHFDDCPLIPGPSGRRGCPALDTDKDGVLDEKDHCPGHYGQALFDGCPDSDGDGIEDIKDACPSSFGSFDEKGCPKVNSTSEEAALLNKQLLYFSPKEADLSNLLLLDKLADFMLQNPTYRLLINGHSDGYGSEEAFNYLSQLRAERVKRYLKDSGVGETQLLMRASGARMPVLAERTPVAQGMNRRVTFLLERY